MNDASVIAQIFQAVGQVLQALVSVLGLPALVISLVFVWKQLKLSANANRATVYQSVPLLMFDIDRLFIERPELKPYFYGRKPLTHDDPEYNRIMSVAELFVDFMDYVTVVEPALPEYEWDSWKCYFRELLATSPALQQYWQEYGHWYPDTIAKVLGTPCSASGTNTTEIREVA